MAAELCRRWHHLDSELERAYFLVRIAKQEPQLEIISDSLGLEPVYYYRWGSMWVVSNSVLLIEKVVGVQILDPLGVSLFVALGWAGADHTLRENIKVIPAGQKWRWDHSGFSYRRHGGCLAEKLPRLPKKEIGKSDVENLIDRLVRLCRTLNDHFQKIESNLTGGKDARLILSLLLAGAMQKIHYITAGEPTSRDVCIASRMLIFE